MTDKMIKKPIEKPKILSDEKIAQVLSNTLGTKLKFESKLTDQDKTAFKDEIKIELHAIAQAQNDYCYKEMLGQFRGLINKFLHRSPDDSHYCLGCILLEAGTSSTYDHCRLFGDKVDYDRNGIKKCDKCLNFWQALQSQLEEG